MPGKKIRYLKVSNLCLRPEHLMNFNQAERKLVFSWQLHYLS